MLKGYAADSESTTFQDLDSAKIDALLPLATGATTLRKPKGTEDKSNINMVYFDLYEDLAEEGTTTTTTSPY